MSKVKSIFIGPDGLRHGWRFLIFVAAIVLVAQFLEQLAIAFLEAKLHVDRSALSAPSIILGDGFDLIVVLIVTGVFALCERRRIDSYGLPINEAFGGLFWNGAVAGLAVVAFVAAGMLVTGGMRIHESRYVELILFHRRSCGWSRCYLSASQRNIFSAVMHCSHSGVAPVSGQQR